MDVLLINPPYRTREKIPLGYFNLSTIPLGLGYIASILEQKGFSAKILDMNILEMNVDHLDDKLTMYDPDVVGLTCMTTNYTSAIRVSKAIKSWCPETKVVLGGVHATFMYEEILNTEPSIDIVVRYEGEITFSDLIEALKKDRSLENIKGVVWREKEKIIENPLRERIDNLDKLPYPAYHLYEPSVEEYIKRHQVRAFPILTTRGCPFDCIFCSTAALHGRQYRTRSISNIVEQIEFLISKYGIESVSFVDDNFTMQMDRVFELCREIKKRNLSITWGCSTRTDMLTVELLKDMKDAGCEHIFFGIESTSENVLNIAKKGTNIKDASKMVIETERIGIKTHCSFILGLPGETPSSLDNNITFIEETKPSGRVLPNILEVLPGTELYNHKEEFFTKYGKLEYADITKTQMEMMLKFFTLNTKIEKLFNISPPNIIIK